MRICVVGGGIVGLASARLLQAQVPGADVTVLEAEAGLASHQTGHNSGVVHAGVYYPPGSLKARLCRRGVRLLQEYCDAQGLPYETVGKVVVATREDELGRLDELERRATENGVPGIARLDASGLHAIEPHAAGIAALHSPTTAITDFAAVARSFAADVVAGGGTVRTGVRVAAVHRGGPGAASVELVGGAAQAFDRVVVCAGLQSDRLARTAGAAPEPRIVPFRGEYFALRPDRAALVNGLIYPVPDPALPFLGIHLTRRIGGGVLVGPNAVLALGRESYRWRDVQWGDVRELAAWPGAWRLVANQRRAALGELRRSASRRRFMDEARRYVPALEARDVTRAIAGVRAQAVAADGSLVDDFLLEQVGPIAFVRNAPSPAATSSMAIAEELAERLGLTG